ncbi:hypothetical protein K431DRAFT_260783 [Polychaeton citri CBS 116435]|uniref:Transcription factor IIIC subunit 5 HTH domain-containing protein n=1 Tax=Polychaeton citri CBS 116435 TaxID=1314669 RepID=A0A9P4UR39_9PEZI|nr:hypothetical protein K431DRAFT_260783 [Polychaeton citri CBS 116435]
MASSASDSRGMNGRPTGDAPTFPIPASRIVSVEHPCVVRNFDNGFLSLGKEAHLKHVLDHTLGETRSQTKQTGDTYSSRAEPVAAVSLRPRDPFANKLTSTGVETQNILIKVTLPKRTGRKRKRGSDEAFAEPPQAPKRNDSITAPELLHRLRENASRLAIAPVGMIKETHRFRSIPDFQLQHGELPVMHEIKRHILPPSYDSLSKFHVDTVPFSTTATTFPAPPRFTTTEQPYYYNYQQSAFVKFDVDETGQPTTSVHLSSKPRMTSAVDNEAPEVPQAPPKDISYGNRGHLLHPVVEKISAILEQQPIITRRHLRNTMPDFGEALVREATEFVAYNFKGGPWRDTAIKYGVDPRTDPKYRFYQTVSFQTEKGRSSASHPGKYRLKHDDLDSHLFDGTKASYENKTFQLCDITDPMLKVFIDTENIRSECDRQLWGWYGNGSMSKLRIIMREKMSCILRGKAPAQDVLEEIAKMPEYIDAATVDQTYPKGKSSRLLMRLTTSLRGAAFHNVNREAEIKARRSRRPTGGKKGEASTSNPNDQIRGIETSVQDIPATDEAVDEDDDDIEDGAGDDASEDAGDDDGEDIDGYDDDDDDENDNAGEEDDADGLDVILDAREPAEGPGGDALPNHSGRASDVAGLT